VAGHFLKQMPARSARGVWLVCILQLAFSGCTVGPDYVRPKSAVPEHFVEVEKTPPGSSGKPVQSDSCLY
jgi:hypothetical protein